MKQKSQNSVAAGAVLICLGIVLIALQIFEGLSDAILFFAIGGAFVAAYLVRRAYGLLIPGGILLGLGLGQVGERALTDFGDLNNVGLGLGFLAIYVIALVYEGRSHWWPIVPGGVLLITGLSSGNRVFEDLFAVGWPLILIFIGLAILIGAFRPRGRS